LDEEAAMAVRGFGMVALALSVGALALGACSASDGSEASGGSSGSGNSGGSGNAGGSSGTGGAFIDAGGGSAGGDGASDVCDDTVDIVFVMDVSTSMGAFLNKLAQEILAVDTAIKALNLNAPPQYGLVVFVDDTKFINNAQPYTDLNQLKADFESWSSFTSSNNQTNGSGQNLTWPENSLDGLYRAAQEFPWRPENSTLRLVIHTTDDTFWNGPTTANGVSIQHGYPETLALLQQQKVRVFSFAAKLGDLCECTDVTPGWFAGYQGQPPIPSATGGNAFDIDQVMSNQVSLSAALTGAVIDSRCKPYPPPT
jgi:hypothetical protein